MDDVIKAETSWGCPVCKKPGRKGARVVSVGGFYRHPACVSDPAPTVETMGTKMNDTDEAKLDDAFGEDFDSPAPAPDGPEKGPWFGAMYDGRCSSCQDRTYEGDRIRADGQGGYECEDCGESEDPAPKPSDWQAQASAAAARYVTALDGVGEVAEIRILVPADDPFDTPADVLPVAERVNVSGQPPTEYEWRGKTNMGYLVHDPALGDYRRYGNGKPKGIVRVTTFNKGASDNKAIGDWGKRNVVIGAARRPDIVRKAHGLTHEKDRAELDRIWNELEVSAGAKVSADEGTFLHDFTEQMDAGLKTWQDAPPMYQANLKLYAEALEEYGLEPVPGLIERIVMISEFGGVVGKFDRVMYHRPSGQYVVVDLKTGKTMTYAMQETETQEWIYAHGINQNGVWDGHAKAWEPFWKGVRVPNTMDPMTRVSEAVGVVIHMPVQGPEAGTVNVLFADLEAGRVHAELCHAIRSRPKAKVKPFDGSLLAPVAPPEPPTWEERFALVQDGESANELWKQAKADGVTGIRLNELIAIARASILAVKG